MEFLQVLEYSCTGLGLAQGVLVALNRRSNWVFYILQMLGLIAFSAFNHLWGDTVNSSIYLVIGIVGFIRWGVPEKSRIATCSTAERLIYCTIIAFGTLVVSEILFRTNDPLPALDAFTTVSSFVATYYMMVKKLDAWLIWFVNDIAYVVEYFLLPNQAISLAILNIIWTGLAVYSFINWHSIMKKEQAK